MTFKGEVRTITHREAGSLISEHHYLGDKGFRGGYIFGLFDSGILVGAAVYHAVSAPETVVGCLGLARNEQRGVLELGRFVLHPNWNGKNCGSWFLSRTLRLLKKEGIDYIITYASSDLHNGALYLASNFKYYGLTSQRKDFYRLDPEGDVLVKQERGRTAGVAGVWVLRPPKHRYIYTLNGDSSRIRWVECPPKKGRPTVGDCYGCGGAGSVWDRRNGGDQQYPCPICTK